MYRAIIYILLLLGLWSCGEPPLTQVEVRVLDKYNAQPLDSVLVHVWERIGTTLAVMDSQYTDIEGIVSWSFQAKEGYLYYAEANKRHYQASVNEMGSAYENRQDIDPTMINTLYLYLELIPPPDPERFEKMHADISVNEVLASLRDSVWEWAFIPRLAWEDIPALLVAGADTNIIEQYPRHPLATYRPKTARVGLVALWLIEAVRRMEMRGGELAGNLMPPSRAPILGTRKGNPSGYNSPEQIQTALAAYQEWWNEAQAAEDRKKAARSNPLVGKGLSWM